MTDWNVVLRMVVLMDGCLKKLVVERNILKKALRKGKKRALGEWLLPRYGGAVRCWLCKNEASVGSVRLGTGISPSPDGAGSPFNDGLAWHVLSYVDRPATS